MSKNSTPRTNSQSIRILFLVPKALSNSENKIKSINIDSEYILKYLLVAKEYKVTTNYSPQFLRVLSTQNMQNYHLLSEYGEAGIDNRHILNAIQKADAVIIDNAQEDFLLGVYLSMCVANRKAVLVLSRTKYLPRLPFSKYCHNKRYSKKTEFPEILRNFVRSAISQDLSKKFLFAVTKEQKTHLDSSAKANHICTAAYLRELIEKDIVATSE